jgi:hypothetical protein
LGRSSDGVSHSYFFLESTSCLVTLPGQGCSLLPVSQLRRTHEPSVTRVTEHTLKAVRPALAAHLKPPELLAGCCCCLLLRFASACS